MAFDPDAYLAKKTGQPSGFDPDAYLAKKQAVAPVTPDQPAEDSGISKLESFGRGARQGATFGFSDEIGGRIEQLLDMLNGNQIANADAKLAAMGVHGDLTPDSESLYKKARDQNRAEDKAAADANPMSYIGGNMVGSIVPTVAAGAGMLGAEAQALSGAKTIAPVLGLGATTGALNGAGMSEADTPMGVLKDAGKDALIGAATAGAIHGAGKVISGAKSLLNGDTAQDFKDAFNYGAKGVDVSSKKGLEAANDRIEAIAKKYGFLAKDLNSQAGKEIGEAEQGIREVSKKFDLSDKVGDLEDLVNDLRKSKNPDALADAKFLEGYLKNIKEGVEVPVQYTKYTPQQVIPGKQSAAQKLLDQAAIAKEQARVLGKPLDTNLIENTDDEGRKLLTLLKSSDEQLGASERPVISPETGETLGLSKGNPEDNFTSNASAKTVIDSSTPDQIIPAQIGDEATTSARINPTDINNASYDEARDMQKALTGFGGVSDNAPSLKTQEAMNRSKILAKSISDNLDETPELANAKMRSSVTFKALEEMGIKPDDFTKDPFNGQPRLTQEAENKLGRIIRRTERDTDTGEDSKKVMERIIGLLGGVDYKKTAPIAKEAMEAADVHDLARRAQNLNFQNKSTYLKSGSIKAGNALGFAAKSVKEGINDIAKYTPEEIKQVASQAYSQGTGAAQRVGKILEQLPNKDVVGRNATLFSLEQNPEYQDVIKTLFGMSNKDDNGEVK